MPPPSFEPTLQPLLAFFRTYTLKLYSDYCIIGVQAQYVYGESRNIVATEEHIIYAKGITSFAEGNFVLCPQIITMFAASRKTMLTAYG